MSEFLDFIGLGSFRGTNTLITFFCMGLVWIGVLACAVSSIFSQAFDKKQRAFWLAVVTFVPILGLMAYLPFSIRKDDHAILFQSRK